MFLKLSPSVHKEELTVGLIEGHIYNPTVLNFLTFILSPE